MYIKIMPVKLATKGGIVTIDAIGITAGSCPFSGPHPEGADRLGFWCYAGRCSNTHPNWNILTDTEERREKFDALKQGVHRLGLNIAHGRYIA